MALGNTKDTYGCVSRAIHWLAVALLIAAFTLAWTDVIGIHKSVGVAILGVALARIAWTAVQPGVGALGNLPRWQHVAAKATHGLLLLWLAAMPLTGWAMSSAFGRPTSFFGLFSLPMLTDPDRALGRQLHEVHETLAVLGLALIAVHVAAALWHQFVVKDATLARMLPCRLANCGCGGAPRAVGADVPRRDGDAGGCCGGR
jgi:cytochrome b561